MPKEVVPMPKEVVPMLKQLVMVTMAVKEEMTVTQEE